MYESDFVYRIPCYNEAVILSVCLVFYVVFFQYIVWGIFVERYTFCKGVL